MSIFKKMIKEAQEYIILVESFKTPRFRKSTPAPPPNVKTKCTYKTPCGWCTKWDKKCDEKPYKRGLRVKINPIDDACDLKLERL